MARAAESAAPPAVADAIAAAGACGHADAAGVAPGLGAAAADALGVAGVGTDAVAGAGTEPLLAAIDVRLAAGSRTLVDGLRFDARPGELWVLVGPNGVGKTTLLASLAGLHAPAAGDIRLAGRRLDAWTARERARLRGYLPQFVADAFAASALDTVLIGRHPFHGRWHWDDHHDVRIARNALAAVDMADCAARDVLTLSGGERRRVALAAVLAQDSPVLLLDEPLAHLDLHYENRVMRLLRGLAEDRGKSLVVVLHDVNLAARYATHALLFAGDGRVLVGPTASVLTESAIGAAFRHPVARVPGTGVFVAL